MTVDIPCKINRRGTHMWLAVDIDSSGMSVHWTSLTHATEFPSRDAATSMVTRLSERYPNENVEVIPGV